ncbi:MFS transporter [Bacillus safensis FO-36b] [Bacillus safensis subsp. safensis]
MQYLMSIPNSGRRYFDFCPWLYPYIIVVYVTSFVIGTCDFWPSQHCHGGWLPRIVHPRLMGRVSGWVDPLTMFAQSMTLGLIAVLFPKLITNVSLYLLRNGLYYFTRLPFLLITLPKFSREAADLDVQRELKGQGISISK